MEAAQVRLNISKTQLRTHLSAKSATELYNLALKLLPIFHYKISANQNIILNEFLNRSKQQTVRQMGNG